MDRELGGLQSAAKELDMTQRLNNSSKRTSNRSKEQIPLSGNLCSCKSQAPFGRTAEISAPLEVLGVASASMASQSFPVGQITHWLLPSGALGSLNGNG